MLAKLNAICASEGLAEALFERFGRPAHTAIVVSVIVATDNRET